MSDVQLYHGDCLQVMPRLPTSSVQMVFADLPYGQTNAHWDVHIDLQRLWSAIWAIAAIPLQCVFTANMRLAHALIASNAKQFRHDLVWHKKGRPSGFLQASRQPLRCHEHILIFSCGVRATYNPQLVKGEQYFRRPSAGSRTGGEAFNVKKQTSKKNEGTRHPQSILSLPRLSGQQLHCTQKPVELLEWLIKTYTNEGDMVLDPCAGSGTTAIAALRTGRNAICIEKDARYYDIMCKRVAEERAQARLAI